MQFSKIAVVLATYAVAVSAAPAPASNANAQSIAELKSNAAATIKSLEDSGCATLKCVASLAGDTAACGTAAAQAGLDPLADVACFASVATTVATGACTGCW